MCSPEGKKDGLDLMWIQELRVEVLEVSNQVIHVKMKESDDDRVWCVSFVYGSPYYSDMYLLWSKLCQIAQNMITPWLIIGDFNALLSTGDK